MQLLIALSFHQEVITKAFSSSFSFPFLLELPMEH
jgi:hypothetical protein